MRRNHGMRMRDILRAIKIKSNEIISMLDSSREPKQLAKLWHGIIGADNRQQQQLAVIARRSGILNNQRPEKCAKPAIIVAHVLARLA